MKQMSDVPEEIVIYIFSFLPLKDRCSARLVCKDWYRLSFTTSLIKRDVLHIENWRERSGILSSRYHYRNVKVSFFCMGEPAGNTVIAQYISRHGAYIKSLVVECHWCKLHLCPYILSNCPNLEYLDVEFTLPNCMKWSSKKLNKFRKGIKKFGSNVFRNILSVKLSASESQLLTPIIDLITANACRLRQFRYYSLHEEYAPLDQYCQLVHHSILTQILKQSATLREISLGGFNLELINPFLKIPCHKLTRISISCNESLSNTHLQHISENFSNLKELILNNFMIERVSFAALAKLPHLSVISPEGSYFPFCDLTSLRVVSNLTHLDLSDCDGLTDALVSSVFQTARPQMIDLRLSDLITDSLLADVLPKLPNLEVLHLYCCKQLTSLSLSVIFQNNINLRCLSLIGCDMSDLSLSPSVNSLKELVHLTLTRWESKDTSFILSLPKLQNFRVGEALTIERARSLMTGCPTLCYYSHERDLPTEMKEIFDLRRNVSLPILGWRFGRCPYECRKRFEV